MRWICECVKNQVSKINVASFSDPTFFSSKKLSYGTTNVLELTQFSGIGRGHCSFDQLSVEARKIFSELCPIWDALWPYGYC